MARNPDQPDKWTVSGVERSYASKEHADKVREFLKRNPPAHIKTALAQGQNVDDMLPRHLQKLPRWSDVHGVNPQKESKMSDRITEMRHLLGECEEGCSCQAGKSGKGKAKSATMEGAKVFQSFRVHEALEYVKESLECGCFEKMQEAAQALALAMCESGCPPMQHINQKLGRCTKLSADLHKSMQQAHIQSQKARGPMDHQKAQQTMHDVAKELHGAGFHQLASLHAARAHAHKLASASN